MSKTVLCFGDSNTWGYVPGLDCTRYPADVRWPGVMQSRLGEDFKVIEEAQNGRMSVWEDPMEPSVSKCGIAHLPVVLESQKPLDLVIIMLGTNDLKAHLNNSATTIAQGVATLVDVVLGSYAGPGNAAPQVLLVSPVPLFDGKCPFGHLFDHAVEISQQLATAYSEQAEERGIAFLDAGGFASCPETDCIHIDDKGHRALGLAMADKVREIL